MPPSRSLQSKFFSLRALTSGALALILTASSLTAWADDPVGHVTDVRLTTSSSSTDVVIACTSSPKFSARRDGNRLLLDLTNAEVRGAPGAVTQKVGLVGGVMTQTFKTEGAPTTRISITLLEKADYKVNVEGNNLRITFTGESGGKVTPASPTAPQTPSAPSTGPSASAATAETTTKPTISSVKYSHRADGDRVVIEGAAGVSYSSSPGKAGVTRLELKGAALTEDAQRMMDVTAFSGHVRTIAAYRSSNNGGSVIVEVTHAEDASGEVTTEGSNLVFTVAKKGSKDAKSTDRANGVASDGGSARKIRTINRETDTTSVPKVGTAFREIESDPSEAAPFNSGTLGQQKRFTGARVDIDLKDADVHNVLRILADVGKVNIVTSDSVKGDVTLRLRNVPWDQALEVVLQAKSLGMTRQGNLIRVAPLVDLEKEREMAIQRRKQELELAPVETRLIPVSYSNAPDMQARAKELLSARGSIAVDERTNMLIVRDVAGNLNQVEELVRSLDSQTPQVLVEARIVEATSRYLRDVGIQWGGDATFSPATGNPTGLSFPSSVGVVGGASDANTPTAGLSPFTRNVQNPNFAVNLPAATGTGQGGALGLTFGSINNTFNLAVRLSAAESSGMLRIVSSPRILTLDNKEARIAQGTLIPFSQLTAQGVQTNFQEAKLQLLVKPHVTSDASISMHVKINRDEPDFNQTSARGDPTILKREAETDLLVQDGHTAVIGGIFTRNTGRNLDQVPFFGDIPLLGLLFQRRRASDSRSELVIFLTPRIVNRAESLGR